MGIHQTWHWLPDDAFAGAGDLWRGLEAVDGGYTDTAGGFEKYFTATRIERYVDAARLIIAKSLAKFSKTGVAHYNTWGVEYTNDVAVYWNDLMAAFSTEWIAHCYGYTGVIGADRSFGPGFPNHSSWALAPGFNARNRRVLGLTGFAPPRGDVAVVFPVSTVMTAAGPTAQTIVDDVYRLIGVMPALGIQADVISPALLAEGTIDGAALRIRKERYQALVLPYAQVMPQAAVATREAAHRARIPGALHERHGTTRTTAGATVAPLHEAGAGLPRDAATLEATVTSLKLPAACGRLDGAYLNVIADHGAVVRDRDAHRSRPGRHRRSNVSGAGHQRRRPVDPRGVPPRQRAGKAHAGVLSSATAQLPTGGCRFCVRKGRIRRRETSRPEGQP